MIERNGGSMEDTISRKKAIDELCNMLRVCFEADDEELDAVTVTLNELPSAQPTLYGYNIEHLELIARVLQKEDLPPERVVEVLTDVGRIVAIVRDEFEETLRKAVEQCMT